MKYAQGNLWNFQSLGPVCITTNGIIKKNGELVMGAGIALQAKQRFPAVPDKLGDLVHKYGNHAFYLTMENIFSFPTKNDWRDKSDINLIARSAMEITDIANRIGLSQVFLPKPGCANGQLDWSEVNAVISIALDDRFTVVSL